MQKVSSDAYVELADATKRPKPDEAKVSCWGEGKILDQAKL